MDIPKVSGSSFQPEVLEATTPVMVDFTAPWCGPCKMLDPIVEQLAEEWQGKIKFVKLDVDDHPEIAMQYQVMGVPTLILFNQGKLMERVTGYQSKEKLHNRFSAFLPG